MSFTSRLFLICFFKVCYTTAGEALPATSEEHIDEQEHHEANFAQVELLQLKQHLHPHVDGSKTMVAKPHVEELEQYVRSVVHGGANTEALGGSHRYLLVRPCERFAGDGMSGLPRYRVTGECCGDGVCSTARWESSKTCPTDCAEVAVNEDKDVVNSSIALLPPTESTLFGKLEGMEHDEYHCEGNYDENGTHACSHDRTEAIWLDSMLARASDGTLPFDMPPPGSLAVEIGCGLGQDSRNMATKAGYSVTAVDVSPAAIEQAKQATSEESQGFGAGKIEFIAYDAMALPAPKQRVDFFFDATVYCGLRYKYLARDYEMWSRILTPGHTLACIQCWAWEEGESVVPNTKRDMEADFEPLFDILHSEDCEKNQGGAGWCFYMKLKTPEAHLQLFKDRLEIQQVVRDGDEKHLRQNFHERLLKASDAEVQTLYHIARANRHTSLMAYLSSVSPEKLGDPFFDTVYGTGAELASVEANDKIAGSESAIARTETAYMKVNWEKTEAELLLQRRVDQLERENNMLRQKFNVTSDIVMVDLTK